MNWNERYPKEQAPDMNQISAYISTPLWQELCSHLEETYGGKPLIGHSCCSMAPGWNVKYRKGGKSLCTLYPAEGFFTCLVVIGPKEEMAAQLILSGCDPYLQTLYQRTSASGTGRWLMAEVTSPEILQGVKALISTRAKPKQPNSGRSLIRKESI